MRRTSCAPRSSAPCPCPHAVELALPPDRAALLPALRALGRLPASLGVVLAQPGADALVSTPASYSLRDGLCAVHGVDLLLPDALPAFECCLADVLALAAANAPLLPAALAVDDLYVADATSERPFGAVHLRVGWDSPVLLALLDPALVPCPTLAAAVQDARAAPRLAPQGLALLLAELGALAAPLGARDGAFAAFVSRVAAAPSLGALAGDAYLLRVLARRRGRAVAPEQLALRDAQGGLHALCAASFGGARLVAADGTSLPAHAAGGTSRVFRAVLTGGPAPLDVALKVVPPAHARAFRTELRNAAALADVPGVLGALGHVPLPPAAPGVLVLPFADGGPLGAALARARHSRTPAALLRRARLAHGVLAAALHVRRAGFVHRDLKPDNFLVVGGRVRVADLGYSKTPSPTNPDKTSVTTEGRVAPDRRARREAADVYQVGLVLVDIAAGTAVAAACRAAATDPALRNAAEDGARDRQLVAAAVQHELLRRIAQAREAPVASADEGALRALVLGFAEQALQLAEERATWYDVRRTMRGLEAFARERGEELEDGDALDGALAEGMRRVCGSLGVAAPPCATETEEGAEAFVEAVRALGERALETGNTHGARQVDALKRLVAWHASSLVPRGKAEGIGELLCL